MVDIPTVPITDIEDEDNFSVIRLNTLVDHHALMCDQLQKLAEGEAPNLMFLLPPGAAKSTYVDVVFVPWFMANYPRKNVILASYATNIARKQGRRARQLIRSKAFCNLFPNVSLSSESSAADEWALSTGGEYMAGGLLSGLTGNRAALGIVDDPIAGREEAESETIRNKTWDAYIDDFCSRLVPGAPQIIITTRWHADDPAGRILPEDWNGESGDFDGRDGRKWRVVCLPAICNSKSDPLGRKIGETLWPEWFSLEHWKPFQSNNRTWSSLYQQKPTPDEGTFFQRAWFQRFNPEQKPAKLRLYGSSDYAVTEDGGDYTVHRIWGVDPMGDLWLLDGWRGQATADVWIERQIDLVAQYKPLAWFGEAGVIIKAVEPMLRRRMNERKTWCRLEWLASIHDKPTRARGFQARAAMKKVHLPEDRDGDLVLEEYLRFPAGKHDDEVDCVATGTLITLADGSRVPIETLKMGQRVKTPEGSCPIADFRLTIRNAKVMRLELDTGETLIATPNHPIATDTGFVPIDMLSVGGRVMTERTQCQSKSFSMGEHIAAIPKASIYTTETTSKPEAARDSCIGMYGKQRMGQSQKVWSFITSMAIRQTIALKTFLASAPKTIALSILWVQKDTKNRSPIWSVSGTWLRLGTQLLTGWHSTLRTGSGPIATGLNARQFAYVAAQSSPQNIAGLRSIALMRVAKGTIFAAPMLTMYRQLRHMLYAPFAAITSKRRIPSPKDSAPQSVSRIIGISVLETREDVYNLTVEGEHVFYANGVLTHNCASLIGRALDQTHPAIAAPDTTPKPLLGMEALTMDKMWKDGRAKKQGGRI